MGLDPYWNAHVHSFTLLLMIFILKTMSACFAKLSSNFGSDSKEDNDAVNDSGVSNKKPTGGQTDGLKLGDC